MHFSTKYLTLALALATGTLAVPQAYERQTTTQPPASVETGDSTKLPNECHMFKPYVAEVFLEAICSLHMTPLAAGKVPKINTECLNGVNPLSIVKHRNSYQPQTATSRGGGDQYTSHQQTPMATPTSSVVYQGQQSSQGGGGYGQQTTTSLPATSATSTGGYHADDIHAFIHLQPVLLNGPESSRANCSFTPLTYPYIRTAVRLPSLL
ncbi:MAG: hypothetical protein Q9218_001665 [Villophora microphyllina]